jgi:hypothetical protein
MLVRFSFTIFPEGNLKTLARNIKGCLKKSSVFSLQLSPSSSVVEMIPKGGGNSLEKNTNPYT